MSKGGGSAPTSSTVTQTSLPSYAQPYMSNLMGQGLMQSAVPYQAYQGQLVANQSPYTTQSYNQLGSMQAIPGAMNEAGGMYTGAANSSTMPGQSNLQSWTNPGVAQQYMSPYTQNVMASQQALMGEQNQQQINNINSGATAAGAFGGDRQAIADAAQQQTYQLNLGQMQANALQNAYGQGQNTFNQQQQNFLSGLGLQNQAATGLTGLGQAQQGAGMNYINALNSAGQQQQAQQQNLLNSAYGQYQNALNWTPNQLQQFSSLLHGVPVSPQTTQTNVQAAPSSISQLGGLGLAGLGIAKATG